MKEKILIGIGIIGLIFIFSIIGGTFLWLIWPYALPKIFITTVIPNEISWTSAVCLTWICNILFKTTSTNKNN